ncbi:hypothetical protein [Dokdonella sp.]|nr:hypothetical protein [Dokdonella sp.]
MARQATSDEQASGRARARRTALTVGAVALVIYLSAILQMVLRK